MSDLFSITDIAIAIEEHRRAYETLRWFSHISFAQPSWIDAKTAAQLQDADSCVAWTLENLDRFPVRVRPAPERADAFARLFASFFQTSFRIEHVKTAHDDYYRIRLHRDEAAGRDKLSTRHVPRSLHRKRNRESQHLEYRSITQLADETQPRFWDAASELLGDPDLILWAWAVELVYRSRGEMHGPAVHQLWKKIDVKRRDAIDTGIVWLAREAAAKRLGELIAQQHVKYAVRARGG